ncbi:PAS domain S-box-containing protein/diguanylate cyclase (GGDEF)-like protein [Thioalkalivibrio sp. ALE21]|uniref:diguanylate cyclase domain-containing protein n=1 Tax=Thioalkalivibrio sp. ALE21 TaxID=1158175 RepID=UPI000D9CBCB5|nr:diguanylate cyclase [Thioalkalivibrio sp. ALE21]PYG01334.1 PAS domain S-box-containing protein/diguanylate cyclase (GGDEF)-like protein [Thioalkalivibrio sp. ALE21]
MDPAGRDVSRGPAPGRLPGRTSHLTGAFLLVLLLVAAVAVVSWLRVQQLQQEVQSLAAEYVQRVDSVHRMRALVRERTLRATLVLSTDDPAMQDQYRQEFRDLARRFIEARDEVDRTIDDPRHARLLAELREMTAVGAPLMSEMIDLALAGGRQEALPTLYSRIMPAQERTLEQIERLLAALEQQNAADIRAMVRQHEDTQQVMVMASGVAMLLIAGIGFQVRRRIRQDHSALQEELVQRRRAEARLRETQAGLEAAVARRTAELEDASARLEEAQRIAGVGYWDWGIRGEQLNWSTNVFELFGLDPERDTAGFEAYMHAIHPDDRVRVRQGINAALAEGSHYHLEHRVVLPDGGLRHVRVEGEISRDADGRPQRVLGMVRDITRDKQSEQRLWHQAHHDSLTGLPNRSLLQEHLRQALSRARRNGTRLALLVCDLDGFKPVNDRLGHDAGDVVLVTVAARLRSGVRESDVVARVGGDEFVLLLEAVGGPEDVRAVGRKLHQRFAEPVEINQEAVRVGLSLGAAIYPDDGERAEELLQQADHAMYVAKNGSGQELVLSDQR